MEREWGEAEGGQVKSTVVEVGRSTSPVLGGNRTEKKGSVVSRSGTCLGHPRGKSCLGFRLVKSGGDNGGVTKSSGRGEVSQQRL